METKDILERIVEEREHYEQQAKRAHEKGKRELAISFEGKQCALLFVEGLLEGES
jgi:hypothetical protein